MRFSRHFEDFNLRRFWNRIAVFAHGTQVHLYGSLEQMQRLFSCAPSRDTPRQVRHVRAVARSSRGNENCVFAHLIPACFSIEFLVFRSTSEEGWPATVTF